MSEGTGFQGDKIKAQEGRYAKGTSTTAEKGTV